MCTPTTRSDRVAVGQELVTRRPPGLSLRAVSFLKTEGQPSALLLTDRQRRELTSIATRLDLPPRRIVYREQTTAEAVFICAEGALKSYRDLPNGKRRVMAFWFRDDLFGLAENGRYVNTVQAIMPSVCYRLPLSSLVAMLLQDAHLNFSFLMKVAHELRELQQRMILLGRRSARGRLATFLKMLKASPLDPVAPGTIPVPMSRTDIANYLGLSLESVSRATRELSDAGIVKFAGPHVARVLDQKKLDRLAADV